MKRKRSLAKKTLIKRNYSSLKDFYDHLQKYPDGLKCKIGTSKEEVEIKIDIISSSSKSDHLVFHDPKLCEQLANFDDSFFGDATYSVVPLIAGAYQLFILMAKNWVIGTTINT